MKYMAFLIGILFGLVLVLIRFSGNALIDFIDRLRIDYIRKQQTPMHKPIEIITADKHDTDTKQKTPSSIPGIIKILTVSIIAFALIFFAFGKDNIEYTFNILEIFFCAFILWIIYISFRALMSKK